MKIEIDRNNFKLPEYIFIEPIFNRVSIRNYEGKSLEQIGKEYGKEAVQYAFWSACHGNDLTKIRKENIKTKDMVEFRKEETDDSIKLFICANKYNQATLDKCILDVFNINPQITKQHIEKMVTDAIYNLFIN